MVEPQSSGRIHFHLVVAVREDIRTGFNWNAFHDFVNARRPFRAADVGANAHLRHCWGVIRRELRRARFGRSELTPIRENGDAVALYVGWYVAGDTAAIDGQKFRARRANWARGVGRGNRIRSSVGWIWQGEKARASRRCWEAEKTRQDLEAIQTNPSWYWQQRDNITAAWTKAGRPGMFLSWKGHGVGWLTCQSVGGGGPAALWLERGAAAAWAIAGSARATWASGFAGCALRAFNVFGSMLTVIG